MKVLQILPHCSTGGMPQYTLRLVQEFSKIDDITVVEVNNLSNDFVVQRNQLQDLVPFVQLHGNQQDLVKLIQEGAFDLLHFQEIPETFLDRDILDRIYRPSRKYFIVVTTHSSYTDPATIRYTADRYVLVSEWSRKVFENHYQGTVDCSIWEYPVDNKIFDKTAAQKQLGFDPKRKHVLHVGLFTPGKNQKELLEVARACEHLPLQFHFVGNMADNFREYWEPLVSKLPSNCILHGERTDTEWFYAACDLFYFPSLFELNPLAVKEALSYKLPLLLRKLHTYESTYDKTATYITDDVQKNKDLLLGVLGIAEQQPRIQVIHLLTVTTHEREKKSIEQISKLQDIIGFDYVQHINEPFDGPAPKEFCRRPDKVGEKSQYLGDGLGILTGRHYGNFRAHTDAIRSIDTSRYDYTLIFEADANLECSPEEFAAIVHKACLLLKCENSPFVSLSDNPSGSKSLYNEDFWLTSPNQDLAHCYLIPSSEKQWYLDRIADSPWDGFDVWLNDVFIRHPRKRFTTTRCWSNQIEGLSLIDNIMRWQKLTNYEYVEIGTSDFDTLVQIYPEGTLGLSVEPLKTYLDRLPDKAGNTKVNAAMTEQDGSMTIWYVKPNDIESHGLPEWIKGTNSVNAPHPSVQRELSARNLLDVYSTLEVECLSFETLIDQCNIGTIKYLKVDTEGHDFIILKNLLKTSLRPLKIRFEANSLYTEDQVQDILSVLLSSGYTLVQRTIDDIVVRYKDYHDESVGDKPVLIFSTGRRYAYFTQTLKALVDKNPAIAQQVKKVWVLDDRSTPGERADMSWELNQVFGDNWDMICFNSQTPFAFVDKFRMIRTLITPEDIVLLLEDDWECHDSLNLDYHLSRLRASAWTQIAFADPFEIQDPEIQNATRIDHSYWSNPFPAWFKHPVRWDGDICHWFGGVIDNYTNNPSLIKGELFYRGQYINHKNFEASFAAQVKGKQVFTQEAIFRHFGIDSLINKL